MHTAIRAAALALWLTLPTGVFAQIESIYLEPGVGAKLIAKNQIDGVTLNGLRVTLGQTAPRDDKVVQLLNNEQLSWMKGPNDIVTRIDCASPLCITDRSVAVGSTLETLIKRYGQPAKSKKEENDGRVIERYGYNGVVFDVENMVVRKIYVIVSDV